MCFQTAPSVCPGWCAFGCLSHTLPWHLHTSLPTASPVPQRVFLHRSSVVETALRTLRTLSLSLFLSALENAERRKERDRDGVQDPLGFCDHHARERVFDPSPQTDLRGPAGRVWGIGCGLCTFWSVLIARSARSGLECA